MGVPVRNPARPPSSDVVFPSSAHPPAVLLSVVTRSLSPSVVVCAVSGEVDLWTAPRLRDSLFAQLHLAGPDLVVDLGDVGFFGAAGLNVLVEGQTAAHAFEVGFCLVARTRPVLLPLNVTGLDVAFDVFPHVDHVPAPVRASGRTSSPFAVARGARRQARPARPRSTDLP